MNFLNVNLLFFPYLKVLTCVSGAQKNILIETVLLSTYNKNKKIVFNNALFI